MAKRRYLDDAPYQQSRAALRERYGTRAIDASAPQSSRDFTPSGRIRYREQQGMSQREAEGATTRDFYDMLAGRPLNHVIPLKNPIPGGAASAFSAPVAGFEDPVNPGPLVTVGGGAYTPPVAPRQTPGAFGSATSAFPSVPPAFSPAMPSNLTPLSFNLSEPSPLSASALAPYASTGTATAAYVPLLRKKQQNTGYMGSILGEARKWLV